MGISSPDFVIKKEYDGVSKSCNCYECNKPILEHTLIDRLDVSIKEKSLIKGLAGDIYDAGGKIAFCPNCNIIYPDEMVDNGTIILCADCECRGLDEFCDNMPIECSIYICRNCLREKISDSIFGFVKKEEHRFYYLKRLCPSEVKERLEKIRYIEPKGIGKYIAIFEKDPEYVIKELNSTRSFPFLAVILFGFEYAKKREEKKEASKENFTDIDIEKVGDCPLPELMSEIVFSKGMSILKSKNNPFIGFVAKVSLFVVVAMIGGVIWTKFTYGDDLFFMSLIGMFGMLLTLIPALFYFNTQKFEIICEDGKMRISSPQLSGRIDLTFSSIESVTLAFSRKDTEIPVSHPLEDYAQLIEEKLGKGDITGIFIKHFSGQRHLKLYYSPKVIFWISNAILEMARSQDMKSDLTFDFM